MEVTMTTAQAAQQALDVQDACNLSGVVHSFARILADCDGLKDLGTDARNRHPVCMLFADKIAQLTGTQFEGPSVLHAAYSACRNLTRS
jgi:hypothetical protein